MRASLVAAVVCGLLLLCLAGCGAPQAEITRAEKQIQAVHQTQWEAARVAALQERLTGAILMHDDVLECRVGLGDDVARLNGSRTRLLRLVVWLRCDESTVGVLGPRPGLRTAVDRAVRKLGLQVDTLGPGKARGDEWVLQGRLWLKDASLSTTDL